MRIAGIGDRPPSAHDIAAALVGAVSALGQRPAITGLRPDGRREQGFVSLSGWIAKSANLLADEFGLGPGDRVGLAGPPSWPLAAAALSAWWVGVTVVAASTKGIDLAVVHVASSGSASGSADASLPSEVLWFGDALDGTSDGPGDVAHDRTSPSRGWWTDAIAPHPDRPPAAAHDGTLIALNTLDGNAVSQRSLLDMLAIDPGGTIGILRSGGRDVLQRDDAALLLATLALRPLVTGATSVVVEADDDARQRIVAAEHIARWYA